MKRMRSTERGSTLFIAVLLSSLLLAIGFSLANFATKQIIISTAGRESQFAFYAADTGVECALYWDFKAPSGSAFATSSDSVTYGLVPSSGIKCNSHDIAAGPPVETIITNGNRATTTFGFDFSPQPYCAIVVVGKSPGATIIESHGYNIGTLSSGPACLTDNPRQIERAIRVRY